MKRLHVGLVTAAILLGGVGLWWWRASGTTDTVRSIPPVIRDAELTVSLFAKASLYLRQSEVQMVDAWVEPQCKGATIFLLTEDGPLWAWYDLVNQDFMQRLSGSDVLPAVQQVVEVSTTGLSWRAVADEPGNRPRFPLGVSDSGDEVILRLLTEKCTLLAGVIERVKEPGTPGPQFDVAFSPPPEETYVDQWKTDEPVSRDREEKEPIKQRIVEAMGITGAYKSDTWIERRCNMAVMHVQPTYENTEYWVSWDALNNSVVETLTKEPVVATLQREFPNLLVRDWEQWGFWQDAPGLRPRYAVGFDGIDMAYLHLNTRNCSLQPLQVQFARDQADMGKFITLPLIESASAAEPES